MQLTVYAGVTKRRNSTALPDGQGATFNVYLKENTSLLNPIFILQGDFVAAGFNYCQFNSRYYWITDIVSVHNDLCEIHCEVDVLATYKASILATSAFIKYAATAYNSLIVDHRISQVIHQQSYHRSSGSAMFDSEGCIVLQYVSSGGNNTIGGGVCADACYPSTLAALTQELYTAGSTIWDELTKQAGSVAECLTAAVYLPITLGDISGASMRNMTIGNYYTTYGAGAPITSRFWTRTRQVSIPWPTTDYRRAYCDISLSLPYAGVVKVSPADVFNDSSIDVICVVDKLTGKGMYYIGHNTEDVRIFMTVPFQCGAQIAMSSYQNNILGGVQSAVTAAVAAVTTGNIAAAAGGAAALISQGLSFSPSIIGQNTGAISFSRFVEITLNYCPTSVEPSNMLTMKGRPYMAVAPLSGFSGYIETDGFSLADAIATGAEKEQVNMLLDSGIFIE